MRLLYFNPENDLALAANDAHYTPPASALQMATDLQRLPLWWAEADDLIMLRQEGPPPTLIPHPSSLTPPLELCSLRYFEDPSPLRSSSARFDTSKNPKPSSLINNGMNSGVAPLPWGWSPLLVRQLREAGVPESALPSDEQMAAYRRFSSRETAVRLLSRLRAQWPEAFVGGMLVGTSTWCTSDTEVLKAIDAYDGRAMLKAPWSGSGRGVHPVKGLPLDDKTLSWMRRTLKSQGGVEVEPLFDKVQDLALEFWADGGSVRYEGLSLFETTAGGVYAGNMVASEDVKVARLTSFLAKDELQETTERLTYLLNDADIPAWYCGPLGVDMMIVKTAPRSPLINHHSYALHPLVEINLRMTMGWVALKLKKELGADETGVFRVCQQGGRYQALFSKCGKQE